MGGPGSRNALPGSQQDLEASAGDRVFFAFDRSDITPEAQEILTRQADWLRRYPNVTVTIEGHCDERGTREYNLALGERRAQAVKNVVGHSGIPHLDDQLRQGTPRRRRVERGGVCAESPRRDHRELKDGTAPVIQ
jgi:outer membrane protein OmpA-like peptidoglycan-associated protein